MLLWILFFTFLGSLASLLIAATLLFKNGWLEKRTPWLVAFAAGTMLSAAFLDLIPEAINEGRSGKITEYQGVLGTVLLGIVIFFFLERSLLWHHHHACLEGEDCQGIKPAAPLMMIGDALHNFLDGMTIAAAFLISWQLGMVTSLAVFFHEIPHEIGNFGILLNSGLRKKEALVYNLLSSLVAFLGAGLTYFFLKSSVDFLPFLVAFAAGNFIYIAASDLIPELHQHFNKEVALSQTLSFVVGIIIILLTTRLFQ